MHHPTLLRCSIMLGLSACTTTPGSEPHKSPGPEEPSGLGMGEHGKEPASDDGPRFVAEEDQWCETWIDARGRALEPTPSFLQAWNIVVDHGQTTTRYVPASPLTEDDARTRICGNASCKVEQPQIFQATVGGGPSGRAGGIRTGFGVLVPSERGTLVVPVAGTEGSCLNAPELRTAREGSLLHITALVHQGEYARYYYHGYGGHDGGHGGYGGGSCQRISTSRTDIVIDVETAQLELVLTQATTPVQPVPQVEVRLVPKAIELHGCADVLELAWTG